MTDQELHDLLQEKLRRMVNDSHDMWKEITKKLDNYAKLQQEIGAVTNELNRLT